MQCHPRAPGKGKGGHRNPKYRSARLPLRKPRRGQTPAAAPWPPPIGSPPRPPANGKSEGRGRDTGPAGSCSPPALLSPPLWCWAWLKSQRELAETGAWAGPGLKSSIVPWLRLPLVILWERVVAILPLLEELQRGEDPVGT